MTTSISSLSQEPPNLEQAFKQFSLETERLEMTYRSLEERFERVQQMLQESHTRLAGKLAELDFVSGYLEAILQHISQGILFIDLHGIVTTYNASAQKILDIPEKNFLFHSFTDYLDDACLGFSLNEALFTKQCPSQGFLSWKKGGELIELEIEATFVSMSEQAYPLDYRQASSKPIQGILILLRDITKVRRLQELTNHHDRLKDLGELAAHLAHEIRNPLGGIKGFAALLEHELKERPDLHQMAAYIVQGANDLNQFVTHVLEYARPFQLHLESVDLIKLVEEIRQLMQVDATWNDNTEFVIQSQLSQLVVLIDPFLFKSALLNLCVNAVQAMPKGGRLFVSIELENEQIKLNVQDTGEGISAENLPKIFSPFFTTKEKGNGLGLAEVQKVIRGHQGWIEVFSEVGKGTRFKITIPWHPGS
ncbi:MAG: sensor histidine kinase [Parachlamydiaceae bacterium]